MFEVKNYFEAYEPQARSFSSKKEAVSGCQETRVKSAVEKAEETPIYCPDGEFEILSSIAETQASLPYADKMLKVLVELEEKEHLTFLGKALAIKEGWFKAIVMNHLLESTKVGFEWKFQDVRDMVVDYYNQALNTAKNSHEVEKVAFYKLANLLDPEKKMFPKLIRRMTSKFNKAMRIAEDIEVKAWRLENLFGELVLELKERDEIFVK